MTADEIVAFWVEAGPERWFRKDDGFDGAIRERFEAAHLAAARGEYDDWAATAQGALALLPLSWRRAVSAAERPGDQRTDVSPLACIGAFRA